MTLPLHPEIVVNLTDCDSNSFSILGRCRNTARRSGLASFEVEKFTAEATGGDYDHLLQTCMKWFTVK